MGRDNGNGEGRVVRGVRTVELREREREKEACDQCDGWLRGRSGRRSDSLDTFWTGLVCASETARQDPMWDSPWIMWWASLAIKA